MIIEKAKSFHDGMKVTDLYLLELGQCRFHLRIQNI
jgi:hypothetical protein